MPKCQSLVVIVSNCDEAAEPCFANQIMAHVEVMVFEYLWQREGQREFHSYGDSKMAIEILNISNSSR